MTPMESPYLDLSEAADLGRYASVKALRREMERGIYLKGQHYFNRGGKPKGKVLFYRDKFMAAIEGRQTGEALDATEFSKTENHKKERQTT